MSVTVLEPILLDVDLSVESYDLDMDAGDEYDVELGSVIKVTTITGDMYAGPYTVTPTLEAQTLATRNLTMRDDVTVHEIPYAEVSNPAGGTTATIGGI